MAGAESRVLDNFSLVVPLHELTPEVLAALGGVREETATAFVRHIYRDLKNNPFASRYITDICGRSRASEYSLSEWLAQVSRVYAWLAERNQYARLVDVIEYVGCAFEGSGQAPNVTLESYLSQYGFERSLSVI